MAGVGVNVMHAKVAREVCVCVCVCVARSLQKGMRGHFHEDAVAAPDCACPVISGQLLQPSSFVLCGYMIFT